MEETEKGGLNAVLLSSVGVDNAFLPILLTSYRKKGTDSHTPQIPLGNQATVGHAFAISLPGDCEFEGPSLTVMLFKCFIW